MARQKKPRCVIEGCDTIAKYPKAQLCGRCYGRLHYQLKKGVAWMVRRSKQVGTWQEGLVYLLGTEKVTPIRKPRRATRTRRAA